MNIAALRKNNDDDNNNSSTKKIFSEWLIIYMMSGNYLLS